MIRRTMFRRIIALTLATLALLMWVGAALAQAPSAGTVNARANVRSGPSTANAVVGSLTPGTSVTISGCNADCSWYQIGPDRWIAAFLVTPANAGAQPTPSVPSAPSVPSPTPIPANPAPSSPAAPPTTEQGYINFLINISETYPPAMERLFNQFNLVVQDPNNLNDGWFVDTTAIVGGIRAMHTEIRAQAAPARFAAVHGELVAAMNYYDRAMTLLLEAFGSLDGSKLQAAIPEFIAGDAAIDRFIAALEAMEVRRAPLPAAPSTGNATNAPDCPYANRSSNLRAGPGTNYSVAGSAQAGQCLTINGRTAAGDWLRLSNGAWIAAFLVSNAPPLADLPIIESGWSTT